MANRLRLANYRFVTDWAAVIGPEPRIGKGKALIDTGLGSTGKLLPDKRALGRSPYGLVLNRRVTHRPNWAFRSSDRQLGTRKFWNKAELPKRCFVHSVRQGCRITRQCICISVDVSKSQDSAAIKFHDRESDLCCRGLQDLASWVGWT